jgi:ribosomal protein S2
MNNIVSGALIDADKEVGLEVNTEKTKYMLLSRHQNAGQTHNMKIGNRCFENVVQLRYLGTTITDQNMIQEEIKRSLNLGNEHPGSIKCWEVLE